MEQKPTIWQVGLKTGVITALVLIIYSMILQFTDLALNKALSWASYLILIAGIVWAHKTYKETGDGFMSYGQGLGLGVVVSATAGVISSVFNYIYIKFIDDSLIGKIVDQSRRDMEAQGMDDEQIDQALAMSETFMSPEVFLIFGILGLTFFGFLFSLIISAITKRTNPELQY